MVLEVDRRQVVAYRIAAQGLHREAGRLDELGILDLGVQDTNVDSARHAVAARLPEPVVELGPPDDLADGLAVVWTFRGAPHLHRRRDLDRLAGELWPRSDADAAGRLGEWPRLRAAGDAGLEVFARVAAALRAVVDEPVTKGQASAGVTERLPAGYSYSCRGCGSNHIYGGVFQQVGLPAGVRVLPGGPPTRLAPIEGRGPIPDASTGGDRLARLYLHLHGPGTVGDVAGYLGTSQAETRPGWPDDLVEVRVDGRRTYLPAEDVDALRSPPPADVVRLLPASDPYLQARDRETIVPDPAARKAVWRILANPGAVLAGGEIVGTWRAKATTRLLTLTVTPLGGVTDTVRSAMDDEAQRMAALRGLPDVRVVWAEAGSS